METHCSRCRNYELYLRVLREELIPALGCTEPIAVALAGAKARELLGEMPERITATCSGNIIKNVKGVVVPGTGDMRGVEASAILGAIGGKSERLLEVLAEVTPEQVAEARRLREAGLCHVELLASSASLHIRVTAEAGTHSAVAEIRDTHTGFVHLEKDGKALLDIPAKAAQGDEAPERRAMTIEEIYEFANTVALDDVKPLLDTQILCNTRIAEEGLRSGYGAKVGPTLVENYGEGVETLARAYPAAGSDARMSGCTLPVVINSGSGNQGMTVSLPVIVYAKKLGVGEQKLYRALVMSNLTAIHQKTGIGRLSAYCGAVSAACGAGAGIAYLHGEPFEVISKTIINTIANVSGIVCDGAKPSCAAKIASTVDAALLGYKMACADRTFGAGEGIVKENLEETIESVGRLASEGMRGTDSTLLHIMVDP